MSFRRRDLVASVHVCASALGVGSAFGLVPPREAALAEAPPLSTREGQYPVQSVDGVPWSEALSPGQYFILRQGGTEPPYSSPLLAEGRRGVYVCAGCTAPLFDSTQRFDSGTGPRRVERSDYCSKA